MPYIRLCCYPRVLRLALVCLFTWLISCLIYTLWISIDHQRESSHSFLIYEKPWDLIKRESVLVPVHINQLYDYHVVCSNKDGIVNRTDFINQLSNICQIDFNRNLNVQFTLPKDFQIRSALTMKYREEWTTKEPCSLLINETTAIIISYRDREENLQYLLFNLVPLLNRQKIGNYRIFLVEQDNAQAFNKGRLYNAAFSYLMKTYRPNCVIFHGKFLLLTRFLSIYS